MAFPTETVYGLGASLFHNEAIQNIFRVKGRPQDNPLIVHIYAIEQVQSLVESIPEIFYHLAEHFFPGPLTVVLKRSALIPDIVSTGLPTVAIRMPDHPIAKELLQDCKVPIVAPSANLSGKPSPTTALHVREDFDGKIDAILDGGKCKIGLESTVLDISRRVPIILRPGGVTREEIETVLNRKIHVGRASSKRPISPGMKYTHYSPNAEVIVFEGDPEKVYLEMKYSAIHFSKLGFAVGIMASKEVEKQFKAFNFYSLGTGGAVSAARHLFDGFRTLDAAGIDIILCQGFTDEHIGSALMNRLRKASSKRVRV